LPSARDHPEVGEDRDVGAEGAEERECSERSEVVDAADDVVIPMATSSTTTLKW